MRNEELTSEARHGAESGTLRISRPNSYLLSLLAVFPIATIAFAEVNALKVLAAPVLLVIYMGLSFTGGRSVSSWFSLRNPYLVWTLGILTGLVVNGFLVRLSPLSAVLTISWLLFIVIRSSGGSKFSGSVEAGDLSHWTYAIVTQNAIVGSLGVLCFLPVLNLEF